MCARAAATVLALATLTLTPALALAPTLHRPYCTALTSTLIPTLTLTLTPALSPNHYPNQVLELLLHAHADGDWGNAITEALPGRSLQPPSPRQFRPRKNR